MALADAGNKLTSTLSLPVMHDLPPAKVGMLVGVTIDADVFKGTCDAVTISASVNDDGAVDIGQSITVIRNAA